MRPELASPAQRIAAWVIDALLWTLALTPVNPFLYTSRPSPPLFFSVWAAAMVLLFAYLTVFDGGASGATPGKRIMRIRVIDAEGEGPIGYRRAAIRAAVLFAGGIAFYVGWLTALSDPRRQTWHDKVARSLVVRTR